MKTKHILTAIALPALLAACSQDEDLSSALSEKDFSNIPTVDANFTASVTENDPATRMATKFGWEKGDKVGLAWLGTDAFGETVAAGKVVIDGKAYQNHPLFCTDAVAKSFKTETMLYVGSYYAYMPFNEEVTLIAPIKFNASEQELTTTSDSYAKKAIYISPKLAVLTAETAGMGKNTKLELSRLSNAATVNLTFGNTSKFTDLKVTGISLNAKKADDNSVLPASFEYEPTKDATVEDWSKLESSAIVNGTEANFFGSAGPAKATAGAIKATSKAGLAIVDNKLTTYILTLPATETATKLDVIVTTNYGDITVDLTTKYSGSKNAIVIKDNGNDEAKEIGTAKIFNVFGASGSLDVYVDMAKLEVPTEVATQAELNEVLKTLATIGSTDATEITVNPAKANSTNTADLTDFTFPEGLKCVVTLTAGTNASAGFAFKGNTVINSQMVLGTAATVDGTMTIKNIVNDKNVQQATLATSADKNLTINAGAKLINEGKIDNVSNGTITISAKNDKLAAAEYVSNAATATVTTGGTFTNNGKVQWIAGTLPTSIGGTVYANVTTLSQLVDASAAFPSSGNATNEVTIDGALSMGGQYVTLNFANIKKLTIKGDVSLNMQGTYTVTVLAEINVESGSLNFTDGDKVTAKKFTPEVGCKLTLSKDTELKVAEGVELDLGANSEIAYGGATVTNNGTIKVGSTSGAGTWIGNNRVAP